MSTQSLAPASSKKPEDAQFTAYVVDDASREIID